MYHFIARSTTAQISVDGGRGIEILEAIPTSSDGLALEVQNRCIGVYDKGGPMVLEAESQLVDTNTGNMYVKMSSTAFDIGQGGYGGPRGPSKPAASMSVRAPDSVHMFKTSPELAYLYSLAGD